MLGEQLTDLVIGLGVSGGFLLVGGWVLALTLGIGWVAGPGFGLVTAGAGALCRHEYRDTDTAWPTRRVSWALVGLGTALCVTGVLAVL